MWPARQVFQAGANYRQHVAELIAGRDAPEAERHAALRAVDERAAHGRPYVFLGLPQPPGNGVVHGRYLRPGDVMEAEITGLGRQRNRCVARAASEDVSRQAAGATPD